VEKNAIKNAADTSALIPYYGEKLIESDPVVVELKQGGEKTTTITASDCVETAVRPFINIISPEGAETSDKLTDVVKAYFSTYPKSRYANSANLRAKADWMKLLANKPNVSYSKDEKIEAKAGWINYIAMLCSVFKTGTEEVLRIISELQEQLNTKSDEEIVAEKKVWQSSICDCLAKLSKLMRNDLEFTFEWIEDGLKIAPHRSYFCIRQIEVDISETCIKKDILGYVKCKVEKADRTPVAEFCIGMENGHGFFDWYDKRKQPPAV
jgi:hypothetical protein